MHSKLAAFFLHVIQSRLFSDVNGNLLPAYRLNPWKDWGELAYKFQDEHFRIECVLTTVPLLSLGQDLTCVPHALHS